MNPNIQQRSGPANLALVCSLLFVGISGFIGPKAFSQPTLSTQFRPLEFTNRAQCAIQSASPTRSMLVVGDSFEAGRLAFNLKSALTSASGTGISSLAISEDDAMTAFRKSVGFTFKIVIQKLLEGDLPYVSGPTADPAFQSLLKSCERQTGCRQLESKIEELWLLSLRASPPQAAGSAARLGCHKVTKFSALHGHLNKTRPQASDLTEIAKVLTGASHGVTACDSNEISPDRHFLLQLDLLAMNETSFESRGFDFWNSVKTYTAWAWRRSPEVHAAMGRFGKLFPSLTLEEQVLLVPNGCRSVTLPKCELQRLSLDAVRELAKPPGVVSGFEQNLPNGPQDDVIKRGVRSVNNGFLGTQASDAAAWAKNFVTRFNEARWVSRNKIQGALRNARLLERIPGETLLKDISADLKTFDAGKNHALLSQMAAVCLEARVLEDPGLKILRPDFENVIKAGLLPESQNRLQEIAQSALDLARGLRPLCESLERSLFQTRRSDSKTFTWTYLSDWSRERMGPLVSLDESQVQVDSKERALGWPRPENYLNLVSPKTTTDSSSAIILCRSPLSCAQLIFKSYVDIYYVATWSAAFQNARKLKDTNLFNPYAEMTACRIYDPWFATEQANADLTQRLIVSALSAPLPVPLFFESTERRPRAISLQPKTSGPTANQPGELQFEAVYAGEDSKKTFFTDLGPLTGAPCAVQYSTDAGAPFQVYGVSGVTVNFCSDGKQGVADASDDGTTKQSTAKYSVCGGCTVNATSAVSAASYAAPPGPLRFLFGAMRAFGLYSDATKDAVNRPISYTVNPAYVVDTYRDNGATIPSSCTNSLTKGYRCHSDICAAHAAEVFEVRSGQKAISSGIRYDGEERSSVGGQQTGVVGLRAEGCDSEILARVRCDAAKGDFEVIGEFSAFSKQCTSVIQKMKSRTR